jgi:hypothetical protein
MSSDRVSTGAGPLVSALLAVFSGVAVVACQCGPPPCADTVCGDSCVKLDSDPNNCGACGTVCTSMNGTPACVAGSCTVSSCNAGFGDCDGNPANGCEVNLNTDVQHCGTCATNCTQSCALNAQTHACNAGACAITACSGGFVDLDGECFTGCECDVSPTPAVDCSTPVALGEVALGQTITRADNLVPTGREIWYTVTFTGNASPGSTSDAYHPHIRFSPDAGNIGPEFAFDVRSDCEGNALSCEDEDGGTSNARTDWEVFSDATPTPITKPVPPVGDGGIVLIRVYRPGPVTTCNYYELTISN